MPYELLTKIVYVVLSHIVAYMLTFFYLVLKIEILNFNVVKLIDHSIYGLGFFLLFKKFFFTVRS